MTFFGGMVFCSGIMFYFSSVFFSGFVVGGFKYHRLRSNKTWWVFASELLQGWSGIFFLKPGYEKSSCLKHTWKIGEVCDVCKFLEGNSVVKSKGGNEGCWGWTVGSLFKISSGITGALSDILQWLGWLNILSLFIWSLLFRHGKITLFVTPVFEVFFSFWNIHYIWYSRYPCFTSGWRPFMSSNKYKGSR